MSDFVREVDEDYRRDQLINFWRRFGWLFLLVAGLIILGVAGYTYYADARQKALEEQATQFIRAQQLIKLEREDEALAELNDMLGGDLSSGYRGLAGLTRAQLLTGQGKTTEAIAAYQSMGADSTLSESMRTLATLSYAGLVHDNRTAAELEEILAPVLATSDFKHSAEELVAAALLREGNTQEALSYLRRIRQTETAPNTLRARAQTLLDALEDESLPDISEALVEETPEPAAEELAP
ncbi:MAG: tetratricopeptide repeat protein [Pseudomonadota bacterium]